MRENDIEKNDGVIRLTPEESEKFWKVLSDTSAAEANVLRLLEKHRGITVERDVEATRHLAEAMLKVKSSQSSSVF